MHLRHVANEWKYDLAASMYDTIAFIMSLGQNKKIYRAVAGAIAYSENQTIVEFGCGPASVVPFIHAKCSRSSTMIGIDFSENMIARANKAKQEHHWDNVAFKCMDMHAYPEDEPIDTAVFCLALTAIPHALEALEKSLALLRPGGQFVIADSFPLHGRWWHVFTNAYISVKSLVVGAKPTQAVLPFLEEHMEDVRVTHMAGGVYTLVSARKRANRAPGMPAC